MADLTDPTMAPNEQIKPQEFKIGGYSFVELPSDFMNTESVPEDIKGTFTLKGQGFIVIIDHSGKPWIHCYTGAHLALILIENGFAEEGMFFDRGEARINESINPKYLTSMTRFRDTEWYNSQITLLDSSELEDLNGRAGFRLIDFRRQINILEEEGMTYRRAQRVLYKLFRVK